MASVERDNCHSAEDQSHAFQNKVSVQVTDGYLAQAWFRNAGQVIEDLGGDDSSQVAGRIRSLKRHADGKMRMKLSGAPGKVHIIVSSVVELSVVV